MSSGFAACFLALQTAIRCSQQSVSHSSHKDHHSSSTNYTDDEEEESYNPTRCFNARVDPDPKLQNTTWFRGCTNASVTINCCNTSPIHTSFNVVNCVFSTNDPAKDHAEPQV